MEKTEAELERNINEITMDTSFQSTVQKKDITTINNYGYNEQDDQVGKINESKEQVDASSRSSTKSAKQVKQRFKGRYSHYQRNSKIINQPHPSLLQSSYHLTGYRRECPRDIMIGSPAREFGTTPDN